MKRVIHFFIIVPFILLSCSKAIDQFDEPGISDAYSAASSFSTILSKAAHDNQNIRFFIKSKALEQFDYDYDVFYPFVKNSEVEPGKTFRDILLEYTDEKSLCAIEKAIPKLTILVPDWSWIRCFNVNEWDATEQNIAVGCVSYDGMMNYYDDGEFIGACPDGSFPDFPVLIVKSNERMICTPSTKGEEPRYEFVDEAFNNKSTKVKPVYSHELVDGVPDDSYFVPASEISDRVKEAYSYFHNSGDRIYQRDYIYYDMTTEGQMKPRRENVWETIYMFKFSSFSASKFIFDDVPADLNKKALLEKCIDYKWNNHPMSQDELRSSFVADGGLDLYFMFYIPTIGGGVFSTEKYFPVSFSDVFSVEYINLEFRHKTWFTGEDHWIYTINEEAIHPKWCEINCELPRWDISQQSNTISIVVSEFDETGSSKYTYTTQSSHTDNWKIDGDISGEIKGVTCKVGLGYGSTTVKNDTETWEYTRSQGGVDKLGQAELEYLKPVLMRKIKQNGVEGYIVNDSHSTGFVDLMIIPKSY